MHEIKKFSIAPQLGFAGEVYDSNYQYNQRVRKSSGNMSFGKIGFEVRKEKVSFRVNALRTINQNLANDRVEAKYRFSINLNYTL